MTTTLSKEQLKNHFKKRIIESGSLHLGDVFPQYRSLVKELAEETTEFLLENGIVTYIAGWDGIIRDFHGNVWGE